MEQDRQSQSSRHIRRFCVPGCWPPSLVDPAGSQRAIETALESVRVGGGPADKGLRLYAEGMLLRAAGRNEDAAARFREGASDQSPYTRYLNGSAQNDPPLPRTGPSTSPPAKM